MRQGPTRSDGHEPPSRRAAAPAALLGAGLFTFAVAALTGQVTIAAVALVAAVVLPALHGFTHRVRTGAWPYDPAPTRADFMRRGLDAMHRGDDLVEVHRPSRKDR